jgi:hypothetical protein
VPTPFNGYPNIVVQQPRVMGNKTYLTFGIILTTPQFQEDAKAFVILHDPDSKFPAVVSI